MNEGSSEFPIINFGAIKVIIKGFNFFDSDVKKIYDKTKIKVNDVSIIFINSNLVFGLDHLTGILKIINDEKKRNSKSQIKNLEIGFLLRICYTNQIKDALKANFGDKKNKAYVIILISNDNNQLLSAYNSVSIHGTEDSHLMFLNESKKNHIINLFFKDKFKDQSNPLIKGEEKFTKFLVERAAVSLK